jgi:glutamate racemase
VDDRPIGVFDSGFGGITVLAEAARLLPEERFLFLGDNQNAPYGDRSAEEVLAFTRLGVGQLTSLGCKAVVIACNTATSAAAEALRQELALPVIGMEPALKPAALLPRQGTVLVMATAMTLRLEKFHQLMARYGHDAVPVPCPGLVELIEAGDTDGPRVEALLRALLGPHLDAPVKAVVLGCTHYVFLRRALARLLPQGVALVDGNLGTARQLQARLSQAGLLRGSGEPAPAPRFMSTSPDAAIPQRMQAWYRCALDELP